MAPRPNRGVFFDSRIIHAGRARWAGPVRRSVLRWRSNWKPRRPLKDRRLERTRMRQGESDFGLEEISREGVERVYRARTRADQMAASVRERLTEMAKTIRLPGVPPGENPDDRTRTALWSRGAQRGAGRFRRPRRRMKC